MCIRDSPDIDVARLRRVCVHACEPECGIELLAANAGKVLLSIEEYRDEAITPAFVEMLYARLVAGIEAVPEDVSARVEGLELLCSFINGDTGPLKGQCGDHRLIVALTALFFVSASGMFPVGNAPFAYLLYLLLLHRSGYHFSAHAPVMRLLYGTDSALCAQERGRYAAEADAPTLPFEPGDLAVEYDGTYDWTFVFERAVELILEEQRWVMTKQMCIRDSPRGCCAGR